MIRPATSLALPPPGTPYHRLARTPATPWWRPVLGVIAVLLAFATFLALLVGVAYAIHDPRLDASGAGPLADQIWEFAIWLAAVGVAVAAVLLVARLVDRRPAGSVSSVAGRLRWRWLGTCTAVACTIYGILVAGSLLVEPPRAQTGGVDWELVAAVGVVGVALIPLQAAGEEYLFRGYLAQAVGAFLSSPWPPAVVLSLLFGLAHGTDQGTWTFVDRAGFGLLAAWLTVRTGGLEAAIAIHLVGNVLGCVLTALDGEFGSLLVGRWEAATPVEAAVSLGASALAAWQIDRLSRRRDVRTTWTAQLSATAR